MFLYVSGRSEIHMEAPWHIPGPPLDNVHHQQTIFQQSLENYILNCLHHFLTQHINILFSWLGARSVSGRKTSSNLWAWALVGEPRISNVFFPENFFGLADVP